MQEVNQLRTVTSTKQDVSWISVEKAFIHRVWLLVGGFFLIVVLVVISCGAALVISVEKRDAGSIVLLATLLFKALFPIILLAFISIYLRSIGPMRVKVGVDGNSICLADYGGKILVSLPISTALTDGQYLLVGRRIIPFSHFNRDAFQRDQLIAVILKKLPNSNFVSPHRFLWSAIRAGNLGLICGVFVIALTVVLKRISF